MIDRLIEKIIEKKSPICVGLDTQLSYVPDSYRSGDETKPLEYAAENIVRFNKAIVDAVCDIVPAVKVQSAYYEMYGVSGEDAFYQTIRYAKQKGLIVIADVKRNDIGSTASAYARAYLGSTEVCGREERAFDADFATVNAYLGYDGVKPFIEVCKERKKGIFILIKTSNLSSGELQDLILQDGTKVFEYMARLTEEWGKPLTGKYGYSSVGGVVGATYPEQAQKIRDAHPHLFTLIPGYGAQGAGAKDLLAHFDSRGLGGIVNNSRGILTAYKNERCGGASFDQCARQATLDMRESILKTFEENGIQYEQRER